MSDAELVSVRILDREFKVMCTPSERRGLMEAALFLDSQMREIRESGKLTSMEKIAVMCALNLADELLKARQENTERRDQVDQRVIELARKLTEVQAADD